jgi:hypothetical protein
MEDRTILESQRTGRVKRIALDRLAQASRKEERLVMISINTERVARVALLKMANPPLLTQSRSLMMASMSHGSRALSTLLRKRTTRLSADIGEADRVVEGGLLFLKKKNIL